jgi:hypothetical protein
MPNVVQPFFFTFASFGVSRVEQVHVAHRLAKRGEIASGFFQNKNPVANQLQLNTMEIVVPKKRALS